MRNELKIIHLKYKIINIPINYMNEIKIRILNLFMPSNQFDFFIVGVFPSFIKKHISHISYMNLLKIAWSSLKKK